MPLEPPSRSNDYLFLALHKLSAETLGGVTTDIATRLNELEAALDGFEATAQSQVETAIDGVLVQLQSVVTTTREEVETLSEQASTASDLLAAILQGVLPADQVSIDASTGLSSTDVLGALTELQTALTAEIEARTVGLAAVKPVLFTDISSATTLVAGEAYRFVGANVTHSLPDAPKFGDTIAFLDGEVIGDTATVSISGGAKAIMGSTDPFVVDTPGAAFMLWYDNSEWRLVI